MTDAPPPPLPPPPSPPLVPAAACARPPRRILAGLLDLAMALAFIVACAVPAIYVLISSMPDDDCQWMSVDARTTSSCRSGVFSPAGALWSLAGAAGIVVLGWVLSTRRVAITGATLGQRMLGLRTVDANTGLPIGFARTAGRRLTAWLLSTHLFGLGYIWALWDDRTRTWHDVLLNTVVVRDDRGPRGKERILHERADDGRG